MPPSATRPRSSAAISAASRRSCGSRAATASTSTSGRPAAAATMPGASGPATKQRHGRLEREHGGELGDALRPAELIPRRRARPRCGGRAGCRRGRRRAGSRQALGGLRAALGERHRRVAVGDAERAARAQARRAVEAREHVRGGEARALEQARDQPRARQAPREVVVQIAEQPAVARVQLGRRAEREHAALDGAQPEQRRGGRRGARRCRRSRSSRASRTAASSER